jgi:hypothetical protein
MHRLRLLALFVVGFGLSAALSFMACASAPPKPQVDVVNGIRPASTALHGIHVFVRELVKLPEADRAAYLKEARPRLEQGVAYYLRHDPSIPPARRIKEDQTIDRVEFFFGSLNNVTADDQAGTKHQGYFKDQLVARVSVHGAAPIDVLVQCLNGLFVLPGQIDHLQSLGAAIPVERFTIGKGEGLINYVDFPVAIDLAERFQLSLYRGKVMTKAHLIDPVAARGLEHETDRVQVTVRVVEGDSFNLVTQQFQPSPLRKHRR